MQLFEILVAIVIVIILVTVKMTQAMRIMDPIFTSFFAYSGLFIAVESDEKYWNFYKQLEGTALIHMQKPFFNMNFASDNQKALFLGLALLIIPAAICIPVYLLERDRNLYNRVEQWTKYIMMIINLFFFYHFQILMEASFSLKELTDILTDDQISRAWGNAILWTIFFLVLHIIMLRRDSKNRREYL
ncbi:MAG: hypothetical protein VZQ80_09925 [Lachnospiraceae bacterium]|nr:hypothetical protein [Lachnospiraceae bacterium]